MTHVKGEGCFPGILRVFSKVAKAIENHWVIREEATVAIDPASIAERRKIHKVQEELTSDGRGWK